MPFSISGSVESIDLNTRQLIGDTQAPEQAFEKSHIIERANALPLGTVRYE
ncbi:hypothetical protein CEV31_2194 [Brucella thiophenivorans]|uniref:Uncharacterized protein n=1 Tax=Brucella thiophenivorans TaxID=571255 RepID=A0A256FVJ8_9HYPH|nr:hypothetical protein CEV31_2194 [Brucella thiophenivorans]